MSVAADMVDKASDREEASNLARTAVKRQVAANPQREGTPGLLYDVADGAVANPLILLEGDEGSGKTHESVILSRSSRVSAVYGIELGENGRLREYGGTLPGCEVRILRHDGSYQQILERVSAAKVEAAWAKAAGEKPVVLVIDSFSFFWAGLCEWVNVRARQSTSGKRKLAEDDNAEIDPGRHLWNDATTRYNRIANVLKTFPGIVVLTARGSWVSMTDPRTGQPYKDGRKEYSVECNKRLPYDASVWVRMTRGGDPQVVACKSGHMGKKYIKKLDGSEPNTREITVPNDKDLLDYLVFDVLRYDSAKAGDDDLKVFTPGELDENERAAAVEAEATGETLREPRRPAPGQRGSQQPTVPAQARPQAGPVDEDEQRRRALVNAVWTAAKVAEVPWDVVMGQWERDHGHPIQEAKDVAKLTELRDSLMAKVAGAAADNAAAAQQNGMVTA